VRAFPHGPLVALQQRAPVAGENHPSPILPFRVAEPTEVFIQGLTKDGKTFRPSDWAERLAGTMSGFRPEGATGGGPGAFIGYSPYCVPRIVAGVKGVIVSEALRELEPMAWDFVMNFARDNDLMVVAQSDAGES